MDSRLLPDSKFSTAQESGEAKYAQKMTVVVGNFNVVPNRMIYWG